MIGMQLKTGLIAALVSAALVAGALLTTTYAFAGGSTYSVSASLRSGDVLAANDSSAAQEALTKAAGASGLSTVSLHITLPSTDATGHLSPQATSEVNAQLLGSGTPITITFDPSQSHLTTGALNGQLVTYGELTGTARLAPGDDVPCTIGVVSIPSASESHFTFALDAHDGVPPLAIAFGNLAPSPGLVNLVTPHQ